MSAFGDAIMANLTASLDPTVAMQREFMGSMLEQKKNATDVESAKQIVEVSKQLQELKDNDGDGVAIAALRNILTKLGS